MTKLLEEIRKSDKKPKDLLLHLAQLVNKEPDVLKDFEASTKEANDAERGTCIETLEYATQNNPELALPHMHTIIILLKDKAPRVKWEAARVIGNIASKYPVETKKAVEALLVNSKDKGTVVRWSTAFALGEIHKTTKDKELLSKIETIVKNETNNGVKNVYLKAIKSGKLVT